MNEFQKLNVSHEALGEALAAPGYEFSQYETHRLYEKPSHGSLLMLPARTPTPMEQRVRPAHLSALRYAVVQFGMTDEETLAGLLVRFIRSEPTPAPRTAFRAAKSTRAVKPRRAAAKAALEV